MIILNVENHKLTLVNLRHRRQSPISTPRRFCSVSGGIGKHHLADTHFVRFEEIRKCIDDFIASKPVSFYRQGIRKLPERWQKIVDANGEYFAD
ncbi:hypothetical protein P5V15_001213 [Pogonomyrmex californicus]